MAINVELPFHKARELMAPYRNSMPINQPLLAVDNRPPDAPNVLVDAVSLGGPTGGKQKPLVRHVLVKDLAMIAKRTNSPLPRTGVFGDRAPVGLYALFDGQSCAGEPGPLAAEFCARNFHAKLLARLAKVQEDSPGEADVETALRDAFEDLDHELQTCTPEVNDGCGAAVALLIGRWVFTAVLGRCSAVLCEADGPRLMPLALGGKGAVEPRPSWDGRGKGRGKASSLPVLQRSLGDRPVRAAQLGGAHSGRGSAASVPDVRSTELQGPGSHPFLLLVSSPIAAVFRHQQLIESAPDFQAQPRAACGEIALRALEAHAGAAAASAQCTAVQVCFLPDRGGAKDDGKGAEAQPAAKKARGANAPGGSTQSMRLRHILVTFQEAGKEAPAADGLGEQRQRSRQDAEALIRSIIKAMRAAIRDLKKTPKDSMELINLTTKRFSELAKEHSECETAKKGGVQCGDLGWLSPDDLASFGAAFKEVVTALAPGQLSDIAVTERGLHFMQRVA